MDNCQQYEALLLMKVAEELIRNRRKTERLCGYPPEYGGDDVLLERLSSFLNEPGIQHEVIEARAFLKKIDKT